MAEIRVGVGDEIRKAARIKALEEGRTLAQIVERALEKYLYSIDGK